MNPERLYDQARRKLEQASSFQGTVAELDAQLERMRLKIQQYNDEMDKLQIRRGDAAHHYEQASNDADNLRQQAEDAERRREIELQAAEELARSVEEEQQRQQAA